MFSALVLVASMLQGLQVFLPLLWKITWLESFFHYPTGSSSIWRKKERKQSVVAPGTSVLMYQMWAPWKCSSCLHLRLPYLHVWACTTCRKVKTHLFLLLPVLLHVMTDHLLFHLCAGLASSSELHLHSSRISSGFSLPPWGKKVHVCRNRLSLQP